MSGFVSNSDMLLGLWEGRILKQVETLNSQDSSYSKVKSKIDKLNVGSAGFVINHGNSVHTSFDTFDPGSLNLYLPNKPEHSIIESEKLRQQRIVTISHVSNHDKKFVGSINSKSKLHHISTAMANTAIDLADQMMVLFYDNQMSVLIHQEGGMKFFEQFTGTIPNDFLYYILYAAQTCNIEIAKLKIQIGGTIDENSALFVALKSYILNIEFFSSSRFHIDGAKLPYHYYMPLIIAKACE